MKEGIYLDYAASTPLDSAALKAMQLYYSTVFGNPSAIHLAGQSASAALHEARTQVAEAIGAGYRDVFFTGSATEANNLVLRGVVGRAVKSVTGPLKILISAIEHESIRAVCADLKGVCDIEVVDIPVDNLGTIDLKSLKNSLDERVVLVSVQYANSEIGTVQPIAEIGRIVKGFRKDGVYPLFHTDAAQAFQYESCDVSVLGVDCMTLSAHKAYGPKGIGALYVRNPDILVPQIVGGGQEYGIRSGTENVPAIVGFGFAAETVIALREKESARVAALRDRLWEGIRGIVPDAELNGAPTDGSRRLPNNLSVYFPGHSAQDLCIELDMMGIAVSPGTACSSRTAEPSYVIEALGFSGDRPSSSIRFSLGRQTTLREIDQVIAVFKKRFA